MKTVYSVEFRPGSREEALPGISADFPYTASRALLNQYSGKLAPWHWHKEVELFYVESGALEYTTPRGKLPFPQGSCGFVNANVLHMTRPLDISTQTVQLLHMFDSGLIGGLKGGRIEQKYIVPLLCAPNVEVIALYPGNAGDGDLLEAIKRSFSLAETENGYELKVRAVLSEIWCQLLDHCRHMPQKESQPDKTSGNLKMMMIYMHEHYADKITVQDIAAAAFISSRECFRTFRGRLGMTPLDYLKSYRLQEACSMLAQGQDSITAISGACGLGSSSYFGRVFKDYMGCTPLAYRRKWQNSGIKGHY